MAGGDQGECFPLRTASRNRLTGTSRLRRAQPTSGHSVWGVRHARNHSQGFPLDSEAFGYMDFMYGHVNGRYGWVARDAVTTDPVGTIIIDSQNSLNDTTVAKLGRWPERSPSFPGTRVASHGRRCLLRGKRTRGFYRVSPAPRPQVTALSPHSVVGRAVNRRVAPGWPRTCRSRKTSAATIANTPPAVSHAHSL